MVCSIVVSCHQDLEYEFCTCESLPYYDVFAFADYLGGLPPKPGILWDYPIKPAMEEWKQLRSRDEMVSACQIPEELLSSLSTEDLTNICVRYPLLFDIFAFNDYIYPANRLYDEFNGIRELFKRKEASKELLKYYNFLIQNIPVDEVEGISKGAFMFTFRELDFLLGFYSLKTDALSKKDAKQMLQCLVHGYEKGISNYYSRAHLIIKISPQSIEKFPDKEKNNVFAGGGSLRPVSQETIDIINKLSYQLMK